MAEQLANLEKRENLFPDLSGYVLLETAISTNSSYTAPADGLYYFKLKGNGAVYAVLFADSERTKGLALNGLNNYLSVVIPLKKGSIIYTHATVGDYIVGGYMPM